LAILTQTASTKKSGNSLKLCLVGIITLLLLSTNAFEISASTSQSANTLLSTSQGEPVLMNRATISQNSSSFTFSASNLLMVFSSTNGSILTIKNLLTDQNTVLSASYHLWVISTGSNGSGPIVVPNEANQFSIFSNPINSTLYMFWDIQKLNLSVEILVTPDPNNGGIGMRIDIANYNPNLTIYSVEYPILAGFRGLGNSVSDTLTVPILAGVIYPDFQSELNGGGILDVAYPGGLSMQFFLIYDNSGGLYEAAQDNSSLYKSLYIASETGGTFDIFWRQFAPHIYPGNQLMLNYSVSFAGFAGQSWQEGANIYRTWATKQWYVEKGPVADRTDIPSWFKNLGMISLGNGGFPQVPNETQSLEQAFPNQTILWDLWGWNQGGFDRGYPNYFPPIVGQTEFQSIINQTHAEGAKVMLFFSGSLVDNSTTTYLDNEQYMIENSPGHIYIESFDINRSGGGLNASRPDPTSAWWQSEVVNYTTTAVKDYGVDGIYLDSVALVPPHLNYRNATSPTLSGSTWWQAWATIMTEVTNSIRQYNPDAIVTSEGICETYIPFLSGFWSDYGGQQAENSVPGALYISMFAYVYGEYALVYGGLGTVAYSVQNPTAFAYEVSIGTILGVMTRAYYGTYAGLTQGNVEFMQRSLNLQQDYSAYVRLGQQIPPPAVVSSSNTELNINANNTLDVSSVLSGLYVSSNGSMILVVANPTNSSQAATLQFYSNEFGGGSLGSLESLRICQISSSNSCTAASQNGDINISIGSLSYSVFRVYPTLVRANTTTSSSSSKKSSTSPNQFFSDLGIASVVVAVAAVLGMSVHYYGRKKKKLVS
jgi:hypothetical protein